MYFFKIITDRNEQNYYSQYLKQNIFIFTLCAYFLTTSILKTYNLKTDKQLCHQVVFQRAKSIKNS